jgi:hypothetical protein
MLGCRGRGGRGVGHITGTRIGPPPTPTGTAIATVRNARTSTVLPTAQARSRVRDLFANNAADGCETGRRGQREAAFCARTPWRHRPPHVSKFPRSRVPGTALTVHILSTRLPCRLGVRRTSVLRYSHPPACGRERPTPPCCLLPVTPKECEMRCAIFGAREECQRDRVGRPTAAVNANAKSAASK